MKRELLVAIGGAAIAIAGLSGCSSDKEPAASSSSASESSSAEASAESSAPATPSVATGSGGTKVTIDGQDQDVTGGTVVCASVGGNFSISIGEGMTAISALLSESDPPTVNTVGLGNVNGVTLAVGPGSGSATAEKDGKTYTIKGEASGVDMANPMQPVTKPFEMVVTCP